MVGEIRDGETAGLAVNASLTGHLVLSTIHTNSASGAIPRMIDMGIEPFLIVSTVKTVIAQRLVRRGSLQTKEQCTLALQEIAALGKLVDLDRMLALLKEEKAVDSAATWQTVLFYRPQKNEESEDGYKGCIGLHEVLSVTSTSKRTHTEAELRRRHRQAGAFGGHDEHARGRHFPCGAGTDDDGRGAARRLGIIFIRMQILHRGA